MSSSRDMPDSWRGHAIELAGNTWIYSDTRKPVSDEPDRACGHCGLANTPEGYDGCIGEVPGALNACCGHGDDSAAYVQLAEREARGADALVVIRCLGGPRVPLCDCGQPLMREWPYACARCDL